MANRCVVLLLCEMHALCVMKAYAATSCTLPYMLNWIDEAKSVVREQILYQHWAS